MNRGLAILKKQQRLQRGDEDVRQELSGIDLKKLLAGGGAQSAALRQLYEKYGWMQPEEQVYPDFMKFSPNAGHGAGAARGWGRWA